MAEPIDLAGSVFGRLTVLEMAPTQRRANGSTRRMCLVRCSCGGREPWIASADSLRRGAVTSCGCAKREQAGALRRSHGESAGRKLTPEYAAFRKMHERCYSPRAAHYADYGGRGIRVCERWHAFENFLTDMGRHPFPRATLEREDVNADYGPGNCRWATWTEQQRNRRTTRLVTFGGETRALVEWCARLKLPYHAIKKRLNRGWSAADALTRPIE